MAYITASDQQPIATDLISLCHSSTLQPSCTGALQLYSYNKESKKYKYNNRFKTNKIYLKQNGLHFRLVEIPLTKFRPP